MAVQKITWEEVGATSSNALLSPAYKSNGHVFASGHVGADDNNEFPPDVTEQTHLAIKSLEKTLIAAGSNLSKVLKVLLFVANPKGAAAVNKVYAQYFTTQPARSCVVVGFPNNQILVELECVAEYDDLDKLAKL
ncbi:RidA family protein [Ascoidea rubescens DSM 1968]|uniref:YjgF-like protein n=1 Tax=Ascoidea rubescens DSM 1968 TaxID=1344418 RepID=A0A1D2VBW1_9ASCO|nr:YjgF-like protein [Ascoidea rubescens DSM 1968]ODV59178.1 YjgF-like protein [Ascoidea rubescens DSM 1968]